jgi:hypothetical protein
LEKGNSFSLCFKIWDVTNPSPLNKSRPEILRKVRFLREIGRYDLTGKHTWHGLRCFLGFCGSHVVEAAVVVVLVPSCGKAALVLSRCSGVGGNLG